MRRTQVSAYFRPLFFSVFLAASMASTPAPQAHAAAAGTTTVAVKMIDTVDSSKDPAGEQYRASVTKAVDAGNGVLIPQGAIAAVTLANSGNGAGWTTQLVSVTVNGQPVTVASSSASVTSAAQTATGNAVKAMNSVLGGFGQHVNAPAGATALATGQRVVLPPGTTLTFLLSQPPAASAASPAATAVAAASAPPVPQPTQPSAAPAAAAGQHWWLCRYKDPKDPNKPALGSRMYFALVPASDAASNAMRDHFNAYVKQNYKVAENGNAGNGYCERYSDDATARAYSMDMVQKQWASSNIEGVQIPWDGTAGKLAATSAPTAPPVAQPPSSGGSNGKECQFHGTCATSVGP